MRKTDSEDSSLLADFFSNASYETKREVFREVLHKASASQREVVEHAAKIKCSLPSEGSGRNKKPDA
ncbi:hypothetical protein [Pseudomonas sp. BLCC-B112]|uniref:hypothetical protein n=1 Tax=Pseudomonas sp. BLCC-B112 TaxID=3025319 RepID=UPI00234CCAF1|nr:hypothetical protein [Pseudomonas sp. BLCC-B112]MDC7818300.1 hypothetical protein [Pseudomonas sp. BLCC-B112]